MSLAIAAIAVGWHGGGAPEQLAVRRRPGRRLRWRGPQVFPALLLKVRGRPGRGRGPAVEQQAEALLPGLASARGLSLEERLALVTSSCSSAMCLSIARQALFARASCCWRARHCSRVMGALSVSPQFALGCAEVPRRGSWRGRRSLGEQGSASRRQPALRRVCRSVALAASGPASRARNRAPAFSGGGGGAFPRPGGWRAGE